MDTNLIFKVLSGDASEIEQQQVEQWKNSHVKNASEFDALQMYWRKNNELPETEIDFDRSLQKLKEAIKRRTTAQRRRKVIVWAVIIAISGSSIFYLMDYLIRKSYEKEVLKFNEVQMAQVIRTMEDKYHVTIDIPVSLKECTFSGSSYNTTLQSALTWISGSMGWKIIKTGDSRYRVEGVGCGETRANVQLK